MKQEKKKENWGLIVIGLLVVVLLAGAVIFLRLKKETVKAGTSAAVVAVAAETSAVRGDESAAAAVTSAASSEDTREETSSEETSPVLQEETSPLPETSRVLQEATSPLPEMSQVLQEETSPLPEMSQVLQEETSPLLENLDDYKPGDVIESEKFDFDNFKKYFVVYEISPEGNVYKRINGKSYRKNNDISLSDLRYIQMPHYNFNGEIQLGEMIVNKAIAGSIVEIFEELFRNKYRIEKMYLIDNYWTGDGDSSDTNSCEHNNTSSFCYRQSTEGGSLSRHALGMAIDINPQQNPYVSYSTGEPKWSHANANDYIDRSTGLPHMITHDDLAFKLFTAYGFNWGGDWENPKDYQHFDMR